MRHHTRDSVIETDKAFVARHDVSKCSFYDERCVTTTQRLAQPQCLWKRLSSSNIVARMTLSCGGEPELAIFAMAAITVAILTSMSNYPRPQMRKSLNSSARSIAWRIRNRAHGVDAAIHHQAFPTVSTMKGAEERCSPRGNIIQSDSILR